MSQGTQNALLEDLAQWTFGTTAVQRNFRKDFLAGMVKYTHVADLVLLLRLPAGASSVDRRALGTKIKQFIKSRHDSHDSENMGSMCNASSFSVALLAPVLTQFVSTHVSDTVIEELNRLLMGEVKQKLSSRGASSSAIVPAPWIHNVGDGPSDGVGGVVAAAASSGNAESQLSAQCVQGDIQYIEHYKDYENHELALLIHNKDWEIEELQKQLHYAQNQAVYWERKTGRIQQQLVATQDQLCVASALQRDKPGQHISTLAGYILAKRRALGHTGAQVAAQMAQGELASHRLTVNKFEHRAGCAVRVLSKNEYALFDQMVVKQQRHQAEAEEAAETPQLREYYNINIIIL